jgi:rhodanese-related sulfurtransferase
MIIGRFCLGLLALGALIVCQPGLAADNWPHSIDRYVAEVRETINTVGMDEYLAAVKNLNGALLLDVREEDEFKTGHVPGVVNIPRGLLEFRIWKALGYPASIDMNRKIYVQCATGNRATLAAKQLKDIGFTDVTAVVMEVAMWRDSGYPFIKDESQ